LLDGKEWEKETVQKCISRGDKGPGQEVLEQLGELKNIMMQDMTHSDNDEKEMATLNNCFPVTEEILGETKDKDVLQIAFLKYIPTHQQGDIIFCRVHQGQSGLADKVLDLSFRGG
jgi:hypothetical protein